MSTRTRKPADPLARLAIYPCYTISQVRDARQGITDRGETALIVRRYERPWAVSLDVTIYVEGKYHKSVETEAKARELLAAEMRGRGAQS